MYSIFILLAAINIFSYYEEQIRSLNAQTTNHWLHWMKINILRSVI